MTVSDISLFTSLADSLDQALGNIQLTQQQLATGKRVNEPSDDPAAFAQSELLGQQQSAVQNDLSLAQQLQGGLSTIDSTLASVGDAINSAIDSATQGADGTVNTSQMATLGGQVQSILNQVIGAANLQYSGAYVFGGNQVLAQPFSATGVYSGDNSTNSATFSTGTSAQMTFDGQAIFGDNASGLIGALTSLVTALNTGNKAAVANALPALQTALQTIAQARSTVGNNENTIANLITNSNTNLTTLQSTASNITGADIAQAAAAVQEETLQEQALVSLGSSLGKMPLLNVLA